MRVHDCQAHRLSPFVPLPPFLHHSGHGPGHIRVACSGVDEERTFLSEDEVEEWLFIMSATGLAKDIKIFVVLVNLPIRGLRRISARP